MRAKALTASFLIHLGIWQLLIWQAPSFLRKINAEKVKFLKVHNLTEKQLNQEIAKRLLTQKQKQIVKTSQDKIKKPETLEKIYLSDKDNSTNKNQKAKKTDKFSESKGTSILIKGKGIPKTNEKGVSASDDFIAGAEIGPMTILNSQEFKYFTYYERIKERVVTIWRPLIRKAIIKVKSNPKKYGQLEVGYKITKLEIFLDENGNISALNIITGSGYELFDLAAKNAFNSGAPYSAPPKELLQNNNFMLRWDFLVNVEESGIIDFKGSYGKS